MKQLVLSILFYCVAIQAEAQNADCKVMLDSLQGTYEGGCKRGKATGFGTATGVDSYTGDFTSGVPDGKGKYIWANSSFFYGDWKKGLKDGKGELHLLVNGEDSVIFGYWRKGLYVGKYEHAYLIRNTSMDIGRVDINKIADGKNSISVTVENLIGGGSIYNSGFQVVTKMTEARVTGGLYISKFTNTLTNKEITTFNGVIFPFRIQMFFGTSNVEIEFFETADWVVFIPINK